jgi:NAD(P)-dependent dehydrogenase (short-subunit alcohol dehydrogenase family)
MQVSGKTVIVTGGASGIGRALCEAVHRSGARNVIVADLDLHAAEQVAGTIAGSAFRCDVAQEADVRSLIEKTELEFGPIDLYCSNAGVALGFSAPVDNAAAGPDNLWQRAWSVNVMGHVYAARHLVPRMKARGGGYFLITVSAAGLLTQIGSAIYTTTKHAAVGFAENLAIAHKDDGIKLSILCPQAVDTPLLHRLPQGPQSGDGILSPGQVAQSAIDGIERERFLILPHAEVNEYMRRKAEDRDRWINGMARLQWRIFGGRVTED